MYSTFHVHTDYYEILLQYSIATTLVSSAMGNKCFPYKQLKNTDTLVLDWILKYLFNMKTIHILE